MIHAVFYSAAALFLLTFVGNWVCRKIFAWTGMNSAVSGAAEPGLNAGRVIGILERLILAIGILAQRWEILAAVIALKTVARFKEMEQRAFAEYFLVGSMFSILWALLVTSAWSVYDHHIGFDLHQKMTAVLQLGGPLSGKE